MKLTVNYAPFGAYKRLCGCYELHKAGKSMLVGESSEYAAWLDAAPKGLAEKLSAFLQDQAKQLAEHAITHTMPSAIIKMVAMSNEEILRLLLASYDWSQWDAVIGIITPELRDAFNAAAAEQIRALGVVATEAIVTQVDQAAIEYARQHAAALVGKRIVDGMVVDNPNPAYSITETTREAIRAKVSEAVDGGWSVNRFAQELEESFAFSESRAEMIAETELAGAHVQGNIEGWRDSGVVSKKRVLLGSEHDPEKDYDICTQSAEQGEIPLEADFIGGSGPPFHPRCFVSGTEFAAAGVSKAYVRRFKGEVIRIAVATGRDITVTPNHPILTREGWVPAKSVQIGDHLYQARRPEVVVRRMAPEDHQVPALAEDIAAALLMRDPLLRVAVQATIREAFHGDGMPHGEVHVIRANGLLRRDRQTSLSKNLAHALLALSQAAALLIGQSSQALLLPRLPMLASRGMGGRSLGQTLLRGHLRHSQEHGVAERPDFQAERMEAIAKGGGVAAELLGQVDRRLAGEVLPVEVTNVVVAEYDGHVYNLETRDGWYFANGIVAHNCRCDLLPILTET